MTDKFNRVAKLATQYNDLKSKMEGFIQAKGGQRRDVAACLLLVMETGIRPGNEESAVGYESKRKVGGVWKKGKGLVGGTPVGVVKTFGATTLMPEHIQVRGNSVTLEFTGKRCIEQKISVTNKVLADYLKEAKQYKDGEPVFGVCDCTLRKFVAKSVGKGFKPKDFRTLRANIVASAISDEICQREYPARKSDANAEIKEIAERVSKVLGNTPAMAKRAYIHDMLLNDHLNHRYGI